MKKLLFLCSIFIITSSLAASTAPAAVGDVVNWYWGRAPHWYGGLTIKKDGGETYICENESATGSIFIMRPNPSDPHQLVTVDSVPVGVAKDAGIAWDGDLNVWWVSGANWYFGVGRLPENGGTFNCDWITGHGVNPYGLDYHSPSRELYIGSSVNTSVIVYDVSTAACPPPYSRSINVGFTPIAVARAGDYLWVSDGAEPFGTYKFDLNGNYQGEYFLLPSDEGGVRESLSLTFDGQYLWSRSNDNGNGIKIYQVDINYIPPTPSPTRTPAASPTPIAPLIDSGDFNGDGTADVTIYRPASGLWAIRGISRIYFGGPGDIPAGGDFNGDGTSDPAVFRPRSGLWAARGITRTYYGTDRDTAVPGDYNGDGLCDVAVFRNNTGLWAIQHITRNYYGEEGDIPVPIYSEGTIKLSAIYRPASGLWAIRGLTRVYFGSSSDIPAAADYSGQADSTDLAVFRPDTGLWAVRDISRSYFGGGGDYPVPAPFRGDTSSDMAIFRPAVGLWAMRGLTRIYFGGPGDTPISGRVPSFDYPHLILDSGDYDGDGTTDPAVFRPSRGLWAIRGVSIVYFGRRNDIPVPGDYNSDGTTDIAVYRHHGRLWSIKNISRIYFDQSDGGNPVPGDYTGDGSCDPALFRDGLWMIRIQYPQPYIFRIQFGEEGDQPVPGRYQGKNYRQLGVFRPSSGLWAIRNITRIYFGEETDRALPADYDGDGTTDPALYRPDEGLWVVRDTTRIIFPVTGEEVIPVPADYTGEGKAVPGIFQKRIGLWRIHSSSNIYFGRESDLPVSGPETKIIPDRRGEQSGLNPLLIPQ